MLEGDKAMEKKKKLSRVRETGSGRGRGYILNRVVRSGGLQ